MDVISRKTEFVKMEEPQIVHQVFVTAPLDGKEMIVDVLLVLL